MQLRESTHDEQPDGQSVQADPLKYCVLVQKAESVQVRFAEL